MPINREDWVIESTQAWDMFLKDETVSACSTKRDLHIPIYMNLERTVSGKLVWELVIQNCPDDGVWFPSFLDAKTGEIIDSYLQ